jgi:hypothetical protein
MFYEGVLTTHAQKLKQKHFSGHFTQRPADLSSAPTDTARRCAVNTATRRIGGDPSATHARAAVETYRNRLRVYPLSPPTFCPEIDHRGISRIYTIPDSHFPFSNEVRTLAID